MITGRRRLQVNLIVPRSGLQRSQGISGVPDILRSRCVNCVFGDVLSVVANTLEMPGNEQQVQIIL